MWRVLQRELELNDRLTERPRDESSSRRSHGDNSDSRISTNKRHTSNETSSSAPYSSSKRVVQDYYSREEGLKDEEIAEFLHSRVQRGRGAVGSRMDETGPYLPSCTDSEGKQLASPDAGGIERWEHRVVLGPEKPSLLNCSESSAEESVQDKWKKSEKVGSSKQRLRKHRSKEKRDEKKKKKKKNKRRKNDVGITSKNLCICVAVFFFFIIWALRHCPI